MGINVSLATSQANTLKRYTSVLRNIRRTVENNKAILNNRWQASEMMYINNAMDELMNEIRKLVSELESIGNDVQSTAVEIRNEEIARAKAEAEAKAREEAEKKAKAKAR
ncbi:hypothetical protein [Bacillus sp. 1NLA3E]|uniref:hypothetical protein n=1 Tax=Bacillus sp. 1NLA3E TaxID=666686 RepID=UPI000247ECCF|nr:hypothetical protein [Bacillus sp. 1NLA3E]